MRASYACLSEKLSDGSMNCVAANGTFESRSLLCIVHDLFVFNLNVVGHYLKRFTSPDGMSLWVILTETFRLVDDWAFSVVLSLALARRTVRFRLIMEAFVWSFSTDTPF